MDLAELPPSRARRRLLYSMAEAAAMLDMSTKTLRAHCEAGDIKFVLVGKRTRKFTPDDLDGFIEKRREACPSTSRSAAPTSTTISKSKVFDFTALRARRTRPRRGK